VFEETDEEESCQEEKMKQETILGRYIRNVLYVVKRDKRIW